MASSFARRLAGRDKDVIDAAGVVRRHRAVFDWSYVEGVVRDLSDLAEDMTSWRTLERLKESTRLSEG